MPVTVVVSSWHANYKITSVRVVADPQKTRFEKVNTPFYPVFLLNEKRPRYWSRFKLNPFTYPRKCYIELALPLKALSSESKVGPGTLSGNIDVEISNIDAVNEHSSILGQETPQCNSSRIPFELALFYETKCMLCKGKTTVKHMNVVRETCLSLVVRPLILMGF